METYKVIDMESFDRADYFRYFMDTGTTIEFTVKMDVTAAVEKCRRKSYSFQAYILFELYQAMHSIENFKFDVLDGRLVEWARIVPTFSSFNRNTKLFFTLYADMKERYEDYEAQYKKTVRKYADAGTIVPQGILPGNAFNVSCIPWLHFEHFSSNTKRAENRIVKMVTVGRYEDKDGRYICPFTLQVSHAIVDGYHISLFFERLQTGLNAI